MSLTWNKDTRQWFLNGRKVTLQQQAADEQAAAQAQAEQMRQQQDASANSQEIGGGDA